MFTFKRMSVRALALGMIATAMSAGTALAAPTYNTDSGVSYERSGKFMKRIVETAAPVAKSATSATPAHLTVTYDKGDLGKSVRHGRFVHRVVENQNTVSAESRYAGFNAPESRVRNVGIIKHVRRS